MARQAQHDRLIRALKDLGGSAGDRRLREVLGWDDSTFVRVQTSLIDAGMLFPGRGRGGPVALAGSPATPSTDTSQPTPDLTLCLAHSDGFREFAIQSMTGSSGRQLVPAETLAHYLLAVPSAQIAEEFKGIVRSLFVRASVCAQKSPTLAALRDRLLPKLISSQLWAPDAERMVERAA